MAKRYYDLAAGTSADAALPVYLALLKLTAVSYWQNVREIHDSNYVAMYTTLSAILFLL